MVNFFGPFRSQRNLSPSPWQTDLTEKKRTFSKKRIFLGTVFLVGLVVATSGFIFFSRQDFSSSLPAEKITDINAENKAVQKEETLPVLETKSVATEKYQSENFQISRISFGGDAALALGDSESAPIEIFGVKTDAFLNDKDNESKIAVSWKSNKMTISDVSYALASGGGTETVRESDFGFSHNVILPALEPGSAYVFSIKSLDRWGNSQTFGYYGAYSSAKADSIFELIGKTFGETFGWAINR